jgi:Flp pilus assembly pilin Flp
MTDRRTVFAVVMMLGLVALAIIGAVVGLGSNLKNAFNNISSTVANHSTAS